MNICSQLQLNRVIESKSLLTTHNTLACWVIIKGWDTNFGMERWHEKQEGTEGRLSPSDYNLCEGGYSFWINI